MEEKVWMAVFYSGKRANIEAESFFDACDQLKENTKLPKTDPMYVDPADIFQLIDIPG